MIDQISPIAWVVIILLALFIIGINVSLVNALRGGRQKIKMERTPAQTVESVRRLGAVLRDPLANERSQLNTLSDLVHQLKDRDQKDGSPQEPPQNSSHGEDD